MSGMERANTTSAPFTVWGLSLVLLGLGLAITGARADEVTFDLRIEHGRVPANMRRIQVGQGDTVTLRWHSDRPVTVHLHGYDIEQKIEVGEVAAMTFIAHATGRFPVEVHTARQSGGHGHEAPLAHVEIIPR
jgi:hypothetical protein